MSTLTANWNYPTAIKAGPGRIRELPQHCRDLGMHRPLLITDPGLASLPIVTQAVRQRGLRADAGWAGTRTSGSGAGGVGSAGEGDRL